MQRDPTTGVSGAKPRLKTAKEEIPKLSRDYLEIRNRQMRAKAFMAETQAAHARGELIEKKLVELQAASGGLFTHGAAAAYLGGAGSVRAAVGRVAGRARRGAGVA